MTPTPRGTRFRFKKISSNKSIRLGFKGNKVVEISLFKKQRGKFKKIKSLMRR
jgi:hypothetical protein